MSRLMSAFVAQAESDLPPFHYGSHYSAAGVVLFYLIRLEPFTRLNRNLQVSMHACMPCIADLKVECVAELCGKFKFHPYMVCE